MSKYVMLEGVGIEAEETVVDNWALDDAGTLVGLAELCEAVVVERGIGVFGRNEYRCKGSRCASKTLLFLIRNLDSVSVICPRR
jgi:hypothetical protein